MSLNCPNFTLSRTLLKKYADYPLSSWRKLFEDVRATLEAEEDDIEEAAQEGKEETFETRVMQGGSVVRILQPPDTIIVV
jgi:hypothetical protein